jgi:hypothetical protein
MHDLYNRGFSKMDRGESAIRSPAITNMGIRFLDFVLKSPLDTKSLG